MKRMKLFLHLAHLNHMFLKSVTKTGRDPPPPNVKKLTFFAKASLTFFVFDAVSKKFKFSPAIPPMKFECIFWPEMRESWDLETAGVGAGHSLSSVSHRCIPCCSGHWPASGRSLNLKCWQLSFVLVLIWAEQASSVARVGRSPGAARVKEVQGWVWVWDWAGAANWATCAMCQVWWLEKTFLPLTIIIKPLNAVTNQYSEFGNWKKIQAPPDNMT